MSELQFPKNPIVGQEYDFPPYKYYWDGAKWKTKGIGYNPVNDLRDELEPRISNSESRISKNESRISKNESKVFEALKRSYADAGLNLVEGSFEEGGVLSVSSDVMITASGAGYSWGGPEFPHNVAPKTDPTQSGSGYVPRTDVLLRSELAADVGAELIGFGTETASDAIYRTYNKMTDANKPLSNIIAALRADKLLAVNVVPICDSFGDGVGATDYRNRYMKVFEWSINNSNPGGFGFASDTRLTDAVNVANSGITTNGTSGTQGALESRVTLSAGQYIDVTGVQIDYADLWYDGGLTTGDVQIYLNGLLVRTVTTTKTAGVKTTLDSAKKMNARTLKTDVIRFQATGGAVSVSALHILRGPSGGVWQAKVSHGGWSYKTYDNQSVVDEIAAYAQWRSAIVVYMFMLGTNSIYNGSEAQTPAEMIASMQSLIAKLAEKTPNCGFIIGVPPKANESLWPVIKSGFTHDDYVKALIDFGETNGVQLVRFDTLNLAEKNLYSDGGHPTDNGHILYAKRLCESVGIPCVPYADDMVSGAAETSSAITYNDTWGTFLNDPGSVPRVRKIGNIGYLSGAMQPNGSTSLTVMTIPAEYRPKLRNVNCSGWGLNGSTWVQILVSIGSNGNVNIVSLPTSFVSLEVSWVIDNAS